MIFEVFENCAKHSRIPYSKEILQFASSRDCSGILEPEIEILGRDLFVRIAEYLPGPAEEKKFEAHRIYADLQWVVKGEEIIQCAVEPAPLPVTDYDVAADIQFFTTPQRFSAQTVSKGQCAFFLPGELHRPGCQTGSGKEKVKKLVFKIRIRV